MAKMSLENLDRLCAECGYQIANQVHKAIPKPPKAAENHITKSLGVLQEDGVYAFFLYQASRGKNEKPGADKLKQKAAELLKRGGIKPFDTISDPLDAIRDNQKGLANNLDDLLFAKKLLEQALIYARYHAKALGD